MNITTNDSPNAFSFSINKHNSRNLTKSTSTDDDDFDCVRVEISELDNSCQNPTTVSLMRCKKQILHPFRNLLCLIGWRPFALDSVRRSSILIRILNIIYPLFIFTLLLFNYIYEILVCQGKLNVATDTKITTTTSTTTPTTEANVTNMSSLIPAIPNKDSENATLCGHVFTTYILPDILHCAAFIIGFVYFRITEGEPMYALMEKVFIHADQNMRLFSPNRVIRRLKIFMLVGSFWVLSSVATHALSVVVTDFNHKGILAFLIGPGKAMHYSLFILDIICSLIRNCVNFAVVMNFVSHCEMVIFYCKAIRTRLEEKSIPLIEAMKQILDLKSSISQLNGSVSRMMSLLIVYFIDRTILGIILFMVNEMSDALTYTYRALYPIVWIAILIFCLGQAARVTSKCNKFLRITHSMRVYGYHGTSPDELDGFLLFISVAELRGKLFGVTIQPGKIISVIVITMIICVILIQTDFITSPNFSL